MGKIVNFMLCIYFTTILILQTYWKTKSIADYSALGDRDVSKLFKEQQSHSRAEERITPWLVSGRGISQGLERSKKVGRQPGSVSDL